MHYSLVCEMVLRISELFRILKTNLEFAHARMQRATEGLCDIVDFCSNQKFQIALRAKVLMSLVPWRCTTKRVTLASIVNLLNTKLNLLIFL